MATLTAKQQRALSQAPPRSRAKLQQMFQNQNKGGRSRNGGRPATRSRADIVLAPGTGRVPNRPFGGNNSVGIHCWDAFNPSHAPLPRSIGPYAVVRTTTIIQTDRRVNIFGTALDSNSNWSSTVHWAEAAGAYANPINGNSNTTISNIPLPGVGHAADATTDITSLTCVPSAFSVQVMNTNALQTTQGLVYAAVCPTMLSMIDNTRTWSDFEGDFVSYMKPRLMSMPKLALRGVQMNSYPLNMSAVSNFEGASYKSDGVATWASSAGLRGAQFIAGWAPIVIVNTGHATDPLTVAVTVEWRVRFDMANPAVASHTHHPVTPDRIWDNMVRTASALGNGVRDIADVVASAGQAVQSLRAIGGRPTYGPPMLVD